MHDPMTILKADHREAERLMTTLGETDEGPERDTLATELDAADRKKSSERKVAAKK